MKQTIEIEVPDGKKAVWKDNKVVFEDINRLPKSWKEFCDMKDPDKFEAYINEDSECIELKENAFCIIRMYNKDKNILPSKKVAEQHLTLMQLHQLRDCYRQGWTPNWKDDTTKYVLKNCYHLITKNIEPMIINGVHSCAFLSFPTYEIAEEFQNNFKNLIEQAGDLI